MLSSWLSTLMRRGWLRINASVPAYSQIHQMFVILVIQALVLSTAELQSLSTLELSAWQSLAAKLNVPLVEVLPNFQLYGTRTPPAAESASYHLSYPAACSFPHTTAAAFPFTSPNSLNNSFNFPIKNSILPTSFTTPTSVASFVNRPAESLLTKRKPQGSIAVTLNLKRRKLDNSGNSTPTSGMSNPSHYSVSHLRSHYPECINSRTARASEGRYSSSFVRATQRHVLLFASRVRACPVAYRNFACISKAGPWLDVRKRTPSKCRRRHGLQHDHQLHKAPPGWLE